MERLKRIFTYALILFALISCQSSPTPIVIYQPPTLVINEDMSTDEVNKLVTTWGVDIVAYVKELINQIENKAPYIDLRKTNEKETQKNELRTTMERKQE